MFLKVVGAQKYINDVIRKPQYSTTLEGYGPANVKEVATLYALNKRCVG